MAQSTDEFLTKLKDFDFNQFLVSYDVKSLFTNIPLSYTINIIVDYVYSPYYNEHPPSKKNIFIKLMHLSTRGMFLYNNKLYEQIDDVAMGCPLAPTVVNFLLGHFETIMSRKQTPDHSKMYLKCMDDIFAVLENDNDNACMSFLEILNNHQHENMWSSGQRVWLGNERLEFDAY